MRTVSSILCVTAALLGACVDDDDSAVADAAAVIDAGLPEPGENWERDVLFTDLAFDVTTREGSATVTFAGDTSGTASLNVGDLTIRSVRSGETELLTSRTGDQHDIGVPDDGKPVAVTIDYSFGVHDNFSGYMTRGSTLIWPYWCGNLFPCNPDPADGVVFTISVTGVPDGEIAVYPDTIPAEAPPYMVAFAVGDYTYLELGTTGAGTEIGAYYLPGGEADAISGTDFLVEYVDFLERTYGDYSFGSKIAAVAAAWGPGALGGMEHHPLFHVAVGAMDNREFQAHEAAHGWYGNGVRIACWEDFVLSEGVTQYLTVRAIEDAEGVVVAEALWDTLQTRLASAVASGDTEAYPQGCNQIDILIDPLWSRIPYEKGAFFLRAVEQRVGRGPLDLALAKFYADNLGQARHMSDLLDLIETETGADIDDLVAAWLQGLGVPL